MLVSHPPCRAPAHAVPAPVQSASGLSGMLRHQSGRRGHRRRRRGRRRAAPPGTCAVATPGRRLQSPPPPPPGSAVTSCSCFPVGPAGLSFDSQPSAAEGAWRGPAGKVAPREAELSRAEPGARGRRRRAPRVDAAPRLLALPEGSGKCRRSRVAGHLGRAPERRRLAVPFGCGLPTCPPRDRLAPLIFICLFLSISRVPFG